MVPPEPAVCADEGDVGRPDVADAQIHQREVADRDVVATGAHHDRDDERQDRDERRRDRHAAPRRVRFGVRTIDARSSASTV